jgi:hypothetical protein
MKCFFSFNEKNPLGGNNALIFNKFYNFNRFMAHYFYKINSRRQSVDFYYGGWSGDFLLQVFPAAEAGNGKRTIDMSFNNDAVGCRIWGYG